MKAYLVFKLPEEREDHDIALNAIKYVLTIEDIYSSFRQKYKYEDKDTFTYQEILDVLNEARDNNGIRHD